MLALSEVSRPAALFLSQFAADQSLMTREGRGQGTGTQEEGSRYRGGVSAALQTFPPGLHPFLLEVTS